MRQAPEGTSEPGGDLHSLARELRQARDWARLRALLDELPDGPLPRDVWLLDELFLACYYLGDLDGAERAVRSMAGSAISKHHLENSDHLLPRLREGRRLVASFDPARTPASDELVIVYGDYPLTHDSLIVHNPARRHLQFFFDQRHDVVEFHPAWERIDRIYVLNLVHREDRFVELLRELRRAGAPFDRIERCAGKARILEQFPEAARYVGATESHLAALRDVAARGYRHALILEDDFCFADDVATHRETLRRFLESGRGYDVCLLACSESGWVEPLADDVALGIPRTACTTCSGYLVSGAGAARVADTVEQGLRVMMETGDHGVGVVDRYWTRLADSGRFLCFRPKMGFQRPGYSETTGKLEFYLD